jgi:hypothetical protein
MQHSQTTGICLNLELRHVRTRPRINMDTKLQDWIDDMSISEGLPCYSDPSALSNPIPYCFTPPFSFIPSCCTSPHRSYPSSTELHLLLVLRQTPLPPTGPLLLPLLYSQCTFPDRPHTCVVNQSINQDQLLSKNLTHLGHEHQAPDHKATQPMMGYKSMHKLRLLVQRVVFMQLGVRAHGA